MLASGGSEGAADPLWEATFGSVGRITQRPPYTGWPGLLLQEAHKHGVKAGLTHPLRRTAGHLGNKEIVREV